MRCSLGLAAQGVTESREAPADIDLDTGFDCAFSLEFQGRTKSKLTGESD